LRIGCRAESWTLPFLLALVLWPLFLGAQGPSSLLIRNAVLVDGTGTPGRQAGVRITGDRIAEVGDLFPSRNEAVIDAAGLTLAPGFIDTHSHHDRGLLERPEAPGAISQGITTIVVGQDGGSQLPLDEYFGKLQGRPAVNVASYAGHGTIRRRVMGDDFRRKATADEISRMVELLRREMKAGALGLSTGLEYDPGIYSDPSEVIALARVAASMGGRYASHIRSEDRDFWKALDEAIEVGRAAKIPVQISHVKLAMRSLWGQTTKLLDTLNAARAAGVQVTADIYPYTYWQSGMTVLFPERNFQDRAAAEFALREVTSPEGVLVVRYDKDAAYKGKTLAEIARIRGTDAPQAMMDMIREADGDIGIVATSMSEADVAALMQWPFANFCSDGMSTGGHPRGFGAFPRVLGRYVREQKVLKLEVAIRRMTSLAADNVGLRERGLVKPGYFADLVLFDAARVLDRSTTGAPTVASEGIHTVIVNGRVVFRDGKTTETYTGRILRHP
jgi:N-acyl-D-amino-acid deacylase